MAISEKPAFDNLPGTPVYKKIEEILQKAKKNKIFAGIHNATADYAKIMIDIGFNLVTVASEQRFMTNGAKEVVSKLKIIKKKLDSKAY